MLDKAQHDNGEGLSFLSFFFRHSCPFFFSSFRPLLFFVIPAEAGIQPLNLWMLGRAQHDKRALDAGSSPA
jgi:hypothetical protein